MKSPVFDDLRGSTLLNPMSFHHVSWFNQALNLTMASTRAAIQSSPLPGHHYAPDEGPNPYECDHWGGHHAQSAVVARKPLVALKLFFQLMFMVCWSFVDDLLMVCELWLHSDNGSWLMMVDDGWWSLMMVDDGWWPITVNVHAIRISFMHILVAWPASSRSGSVRSNPPWKVDSYDRIIPSSATSWSTSEAVPQVCPAWKRGMFGPGHWPELGCW